MSDLIDGVVVEYFDIDYEIEKMKAEERTDEDDDSGELGNWVEREEEKYINSFGE